MYLASVAAINVVVYVVVRAVVHYVEYVVAEDALIVAITVASNAAANVVQRMDQVIMINAVQIVGVIKERDAKLKTNVARKVQINAVVAVRAAQLIAAIQTINREPLKKVDTMIKKANNHNKGMEMELLLL